MAVSHEEAEPLQIAGQFGRYNELPVMAGLIIRLVGITHAGDEELDCMFAFPVVGHSLEPFISAQLFCWAPYLQKKVRQRQYKYTTSRDRLTQQPTY